MSRLNAHNLKISGMVSPLSGTAAKMLCIFLLATAGQSFTGQDMADMLGVSANTISPAMRQLSRFGYLQYNGKQYGWSLIPECRQMSLTELIQKNLDNPKIFGLTPLVVSNSLVGNPGEEDDLTKLTNSTPDVPKIFGTSANELETEVEYWLDLGGVTRGTTSWRLLAALDSPEFVKAFVLQYLHERRAWERDGRRGREPEAGLLIHRLKRGMKGELPAPAMRCEECLHLERECRCNGQLHQQIPDDLRDIIRR